MRREAVGGVFVSYIDPHKVWWPTKLLINTRGLSIVLAALSLHFFFFGSRATLGPVLAAAAAAAASSPWFIICTSL
jgi:hypothetical protein